VGTAVATLATKVNAAASVSLGASPGQTKWEDSMVGREEDSMGGVWGGVSPRKSGDRVWGYNLKLLSTLHNDSIAETRSGKKWGGHVHPSPPLGNAPACPSASSLPTFCQRLKTSCSPSLCSWRDSTGQLLVHSSLSLDPEVNYITCTITLEFLVIY